MKTILIHSSYGLWPMLEFELDIIQRNLDEGNRVIYLSCNGPKNREKKCNGNNPFPGQKFKKRYCSECKSRVQNGIKWLKDDNQLFKLIEYPENLEGLDTASDILKKIRNIDLDDHNKVKRLVNFDGIDFFESAFSHIISLKYESYPNLNENSEQFRSELWTALFSYFLGLYVVKNYKFNEAYVFNGRVPLYRPFIRVLQKEKIFFYTYEYPSDFVNYKLIPQTYIHDVSNYSQLLYDYFSTKKPSQKEIDNLALNYYESRRKFLPIGFQGVLLKSKFKKIRKNIKNFEKLEKGTQSIGFFISSAFEMNTIEENIKKLPCSQTQCVSILASNFKHIKIYVRVHPNMANKDEKFQVEINKLSKFRNVEIINAESDFNSYSLVDDVDLIFTYGSTIGVEAAYSGKPVILVGTSCYESFDCVAHAKSTQEIIKFTTNFFNNKLVNFPNLQQRVNGSKNYAWAEVNFGVEPKYVLSKSYYPECMISNGKKYKVRSNLIVSCFNYLLDFPKKVLNKLIVTFN